MTTDPRTIAVYDARADEYRSKFEAEAPSRQLTQFMSELPQAARVLDLGCGPGTASQHLRDAGHLPDPVDASAAMVEIASQKGLPARLATFDDIAGNAVYDGVWANFSLLHAPRDRLPHHFAAIATAMRPSGLIHIGMKTGAGSARDGIDRLYTYVSAAELRGLLTDNGFEILTEITGKEAGLAGPVEPWITVLARKI